MEQPTNNPATNSAQQPQRDAHDMTRPCYSVTTPDGVKVDRRKVEEGTAMLITYSRTGYRPMSYKVTVKSIGSRLYTVDGSTITVKSAEEAGITFSRKARLDIRSAKTRQPLGMVTVDGVQMMNGTDLDLGSEEVREYKVSASGFAPATVRVTLAEMVQTDFVLTVYLEPKDENMRVIATIDGKKVEGSVRIAQDDSLYPYLREPHNYEVKIERRETEGVAPANGSGDIKRWLLWLLIAVVSFIAGFLVAGLFSSDSDDDDDDDDIAVTTPVRTVSRGGLDMTDEEMDEDEDIIDEEEDDAYALQQAALEQTDLQYLKHKDVWKAEELQSDKYKDLYLAIEQGDVNAILAHEYSQLPQGDNNLNGYWEQIANSLQKLQDEGKSEELQQFANKLRELTKDGYCNLDAINKETKGIALPRGAGQSDGRRL